jgi:thiamine-phosphate pyrophosphorylase
MSTEARRALAARLRGVYLLTPDVDAAGFEALAARCHAALAAGAGALQYRNKSAAPDLRRAQASALQAIARRHAALFIINDDVALARELGADGVHIGRDDGDIATARAALPDALLGVSCYAEPARAATAAAAGADVIAFGSMFPSPTKPQAVHAPLQLLRAARARFPALRIVAIGGIDASCIGAVAAAGAHAAALISAVFDAPEPGAAVRILQREFASHAIQEGPVPHEPQRTAV